MRVLISSTPGAGHFGPLIPFATALRRARHDVVVAMRRSGLGEVHRLGLPTWALDEPPAAARGAIFAGLGDVDPDEANVIVLRDVFAGLDARAALPGLLDACETWEPDVIVHESTEFAGGLAAERLGIPEARVAIRLAASEAASAPHAGAGLAGLRASLGLPPDPLGRRLAQAPYFTLTPPCLEDPAVPGPPLAHRFRELVTRTGALPRWWDGDDDRPLVYLTFGSVAPGFGFYPGPFRAAIDAVAALPVRVLATVGRDQDPEALGELPGNVHVERWVPQADVLPHASVMVCHGGFGTVRGALAAGVPLVVLPFFADQPVNARRVARLGAGLAVEGPDAIDRLGAAVARVLAEPVHRAGAALVAADARRLPVADEAVGALSELATARLAA